MPVRVAGVTAPAARGDGGQERRIRFSFVVPIYHDAELAHAFCVEFERTFQEHLRQRTIHDDVELIFVNDDGTERSSASLRATCERFRFAKLITLTRNFGQHVAICCGYRHSRGEYVGMLNVDMEDPPSEIPRLVAQLESEGVDIAYSLRRGRRASLMVRWTSMTFNWFLNKATGYDVPLDVGTLRVMRRPSADAFNALTERGRYIPGLEMWLGMRPAYVEITQRSRSAGRSSYSLRKRVRMAFEAIIAFSDLPLRFVAMVGTAIAFVGFALTAYLIFGKLFLTDYRPGYTSTLSTIVFLAGVQIFVIGVASLYIGRILTEVRHRPLYVVRETYRIEEVVHDR